MMTSPSFLMVTFTFLVAIQVVWCEDYTIVDNCKELADGEYYMKLVSDLYPIVKIKCNNGYMILDLNYDTNLNNYFTSFEMWHYAIGGPSNSDIVDWDNWFIKSRYDSTNKFLLSPDCSTCDETHIRQHYDTQTTYWMGGGLFGCFWMTLAKHNCDLDWETYTCYSCANSSNPTANGNEIEITESMDPLFYESAGICTTIIKSSDTFVTASHDTCQFGKDYTIGDIDGSNYENEYKTNNYENIDVTDDADVDPDSIFTDEQYAMQIHKPSIGTDGRFCVCSQSENTNYYTVSEEELSNAMDEFNDNINTFPQFTKDPNKFESPKHRVLENNNVKAQFNNKIQLYQSDFEFGTYRITEPGIYTIMEDIEFDFNAGDFDDPQATGAWKPKAEQSNEYPGADSGRDEYFLGFFAGITIESSNVILDLNGHSIGMSEAFYYQQRWFTCIELTSQIFLPGNGPGFFGSNPQFAEDVIIKDGTIGLSSHFGIHGNYNKNILISNVHVKEFEVHGIQFNGFENIKFENLEVGPSSTVAFLNGEYGHMRYTLDRLNKIIDDLEIDPSEAIMNFNNGKRQVSLIQLSDNLENLMNLAFNYVLNGLNQDQYISDELDEAIKLFVNPSGIPYASVIHGIFLNTKEASVLTYNLYTSTYSETATLENVKIHGLRHAMDERVRMYDETYIFFGPFLNCINARALLGDDVIDSFDFYRPDYEHTLKNNKNDYEYVGNLITDVYLGMTKFSNNWDHLEKMLLGEHVMLPWAEGNSELPSSWNIACNMDVMIHSGKGTTGLRLDGVKDISIKNLEIYDLHDSTNMGETVCGHYEGFDIVNGGGHQFQQKPMQMGFSGNMVQGITFNSAFDITLENLKIHNLESNYGIVYGCAVWPANDVTFKGNFMVYNILAGSHVRDLRIFSETDWPNRDPEACAIMLYEVWQPSDSGGAYYADVEYEDAIVYTCEISGHNSCFMGQATSFFQKGESHLEDLDDRVTVIKSNEIQENDGYYTTLGINEGTCDQNRISTISFLNQSQKIKNGYNILQSSNIPFFILISSIISIIFALIIFIKCKCQKRYIGYTMVSYQNKEIGYGSV